MSKLSDRIIQVLIRKDVSIHAQLFRFMSLLGTIAMAVGGVYTLAEGMEIKNVAALFAGALFMGMLFWAGNKFQQYDLCSFILMSGLNGIFLPVTFLRSGGLKSGMPLWFVLGFISLFFLLRGKSLAAGTVITIIADAYCFYTAYVHPERITYMESESVVYGDIIVSAVITIFLTCAFMFIQITLSEYQRKENEKQQAELVAAMNTQSRFLANMSHEIRTPINTIIGLNEMTLREENLSDDIIENANNIQSASKMLLSLINDILDLSKIEAGKMEVVPARYETGELFSEIVNTTWIRAHEKNLEFCVNVSEKLPSMLYGDEMRIKQVLTNILSNAIKYTPDGGNIIFSIEEKPNGFSELGCYEFTIEDNGIGMSPEFQKIMFDPFSRADDHRTTRVQGTGLGMAISRNIVNLMNGNIKVESTLHKGTKITVTIYLELQEKEKEQDRNLMNLPVLVVDDDKTCCESTVATLKEIGITGEWVLSGREAVERCYARHELKNDYFAVILDWKMPDMDGIETARQIRKRIGKEITIIVLTSYEFSEIEEEAKAAGVDAFIAKPLFRSRLTATLRQFTSGRKEKTARNYLEKLSEADYTGKRILLVEDNELNREIAVEILQMTGAEVETAENGKIAVEKVEASPKGSYDLIFMDIQMPVMNGYEATAAIRSLPGEQGKLPIVAMTANAFAEDVQLAKNTGMNGHIAKPLDMNKLNDVLENWL